MKQKLFILFALLITTMTASATDVPTYSLTKADGAEAHGAITFKVGENAVTAAAEGDEVTVIITPAEGYTATAPTGQWYAAVAASRTRGVDMLNAVTFTAVTGQTNQWTFTMERANVEISTTYKKLIQASWIADISALSYTGQALTPTVTVKDGETTLTANTDYTVSYNNNTAAGTATATVTGAGNYSGSQSKNFTINKADITSVTAPTAVANLVYTGQAQTLIAAGSATGGEMQYSLDGQTYATTLPTGTNANEYTVYYKVIGDANHNDVAAANMKATIAKADITPTAQTAVANLVYTGQAQTLIAAGSATGGEMQYSLDGQTYATTLPTGTNANESTVYYKVIGDANHNDVAAANMKATIAKADITNVTAPIAITGLVYTGEDQTLAEPGSATDGEMKYSLDNSQWNSTVPTGNEIGEYTVYYKVIGDANHNDVAAQSFKVDIAGYELTIAAGEYATYYRDDTALTLSIASAEKAQMYTVTNVDENTADVTELEVADKGTPLLVMNTTDEELTVYLVPTEATADEVTVAKEFKGTADAQEMPASSESCDYYAMTGKAFVWVRDAGTIGANKCWLEISNQPAASRANTRSIGGGSDTTGINSVESGQLTDDSYYDLQGRKVAKPNRKGIYVKDGRKVILR